MNSSLCLTISSAIAMLLLVHHHFGIAVQASMEFKVGGSQGWRQPFQNQTAIYIQWGSTNRFHVGDSLRFEYKNDSVLVVDKYCFYHCNSSSCTEHLYQDGNTTLLLEKPGPAYFISGNTTHCKQGQRLVIQVISLTPPIYHSPPSIAIPPDSYTPAAAAPSPSSTSPAIASSSSSLAAYLFAAAAVALA